MVVKYLPRILVVDDEEKILNIVRLYLEKEGYSVFTSTNGKEALEAFGVYNPDLVILDLMLPDLSGEEVCKRIRLSSKTPIIMLTAKADETHILNGFGIGADDYVVKPFSPRQLMARVNAILRRLGDDSGIIHYGDLTINQTSHEVMYRKEKIDLTPLEFKLLTLFAKHPNRVFTREEIINLIYEDDFDGYDRAIDSHIKNLRRKLLNAKYIVTVHGIGYKFGGDALE